MSKIGKWVSIDLDAPESSPDYTGKVDLRRHMPKHWTSVLEKFWEKIESVLWDGPSGERNPTGGKRSKAATGGPGGGQPTPVDFVWKGGHYPFYSDSQRETVTGKTVRRGTFRDAPPSGEWRPGQTYALVEFASSPLPQNDLSDFRNAPHLRRVLARDDNAERVQRKEVLPSPAPVCRVIEPWYEESVKALSDASLTAYERFELLIQIIDGLQELQENLCGGGSPEAIAHRDVKFGNVLIERGERTFTAVLIDTASATTAAPGVDDVFLMSPSNTAPELIDKRFRPRVGPISEKADVFALGGMIGELFGNLNPIQQWAEGFSAQKELFQQKYWSVRMKYANNFMLSKKIWVLNELDGKFQWNQTLLSAAGVPNIEQSLTSLLERTVKLYPWERVSLRELRKTLKDLQNACKPERNLSNPRLYGSSDAPAPTPNPANVVRPVRLFCMSNPGYISQLYASPNFRSCLSTARFGVGVYFWEELSMSKSRIYLNQTPCESVDDLADFLRDAWNAYSKGRDILVSTPSQFFGETSGKLSFRIFGPSPGGGSDAPYRTITEALRQRVSPTELRLFYCTPDGQTREAADFAPPPPPPNPGQPVSSGYFYIENGKKIYVSGDA